MSDLYSDPVLTMLIERNLAPACTLIGAFLALPQAYAAVAGHPQRPSASGLIIGCLIGALGIFLSTLMLVAQERWLPVRIAGALLFGALTLAFALGTGLVALHAVGAAAFVLGAAALVPLVAFGVAMVAVCKD